MKTIKVEKCDLFLIEVPNNSIGFKVEHDRLTFVFTDNNSKCFEFLPTLNLQFINLLKNITEGEAKEIVDEPNGVPEEGYFGYRNYKSEYWVYHLSTAKESFDSLIEYNEIDKEVNYALLKINKS